MNHKNYTKSVDIWAIGIIMHMVLTGGKHPVFELGVDNQISFKEKMKKIREV